jgi:ABC-type sugar transport system substrate-binding protein
MRRAIVASLASTALVFALAACSSSGGSSTSTTQAPASGSSGGGSSGGGSSDAGLTAAKAVVAKYSTESSKIGVTIPLTKKPKTGIKFAFLQCEIESCTYEAAAAKAATQALGWHLDLISMQSANPAPAFQQAINAGDNYIASTGESPSLYKAQYATAKAKGIKILSCYDTTPPDPAKTGIYSQCGDTSFVTKTGPLMADWAIVDSNSNAHILLVNVPSFPVLAAEATAYKAELAKNCSKCSVKELNVSINDLVGGKVPAQVSNAVQADSKINYVFNSFGSLPAGETAALKSSNLLSKVKVYGQDFSKFDLQEIVKGDQAAWSADPKGYAIWLMVDYAARLSEGMKLTEERSAASLPSYLVDTKDKAQKIIDQGGDWAPPNMEKSFKTLWHVSG